MAELRVLGPLEVRLAHRPVDLGPMKQRAVLAALLIDAGRPVPTETLIDRVWGEHPPSSARSGLYSYVTRLRRVLAEAADGDGRAPRVAHATGGYLLDLEGHEVDLDRFRRLVRHAEDRELDDRQRCVALDEAVRLWRGPALSGLSGDWVLRTREILTQERLEANLQWARAHLRLGQAAAVVCPLWQLVSEHPFVEPLAALLMRALCSDNRLAEALNVYTALRDRLAEELGVEPGPQLRRLHLAILRGEQDPPEAETEQPTAWAEQPTAEAEQPTPAGTPGVPVSPAPGAGPPVPAQLPLDLHGFAGRERELATLDTILAAAGEQPTAVLIFTLCGGAGVGKTALAVHWAHRMANRFPGGQLYVNLRGFDPSASPMTPAEALLGFLDAFGVPPQNRPAGLAAQAGVYRSALAGRPALVILDNAASVEQVRPLLPGSPGCVVLVTSRSTLASLAVTEGAHPVPVELLTSAQARQLLAARIGWDRVSAEPAAADEIIARCARLPLGLAVVAARASAQPELPLSDLAGELRTARAALDVFCDTDPTADLRSVFSWSYPALSGDAARLFRLLGLYPGSEVGVAAAASLAGVALPAADRLLTELAQAHLVIEHASGRYTLHDLLRAYAAELCQRHDRDGDRQAALARALDHYLHIAYAASRLMQPHRDPITLASPRPGVVLEALTGHAQARAWSTGQRPSLVLAMVRAAADAGLRTHAWQLAWTLSNVLEYRAHWHDLVDSHRTALAAAAGLATPSDQAHLHRMLGRALTHLGRYDEACPELRQALELCRRGGDTTGQAHSQIHLAWLREQQHRYGEALRHGRLALDLYRTADHRAGQASALNQIGWYHALLGDYEATVSHCRQALDLQCATGHLHGQASSWHSLGYAYHRLGRHQEASASFEQAIGVHRRTGDRYREADTLVDLADAYHCAGDPAAAHSARQQAVAVLDQIDHPGADQIRAKLQRLDATL